MWDSIIVNDIAMASFIVILVFLLVLFLNVYIDYMKFEEQEMRIIGTF